MTRTRYRFLPNDPSPYFLSTSTINWLPLFGNPDIANILLDSLRFLIEQNRLCLFAYVIMENHVHLVAVADDLSKEIANFKSFTARKAIDYYVERDNTYALEQLKQNKLDHKNDREYQFWQEGSHPQRIMNAEMLRQKVEYIHNNPVERGYVELPEHWRYSSAGDYAGKPGLLPVFMEW